MEHILEVIVEYATFFINIIALAIILYGAVMSVLALFIKTKKTPGIIIGEHLDLGLRFLMVSEVLHTFTTSTFKSLINLGLLLMIRIAMVVFNQKELQHETHLLEEELEKAEELGENE